MNGIAQKLEVAHGSFGEQYTTSQGVTYLTWFDLMNRNLRGLRPGVFMEYEVASAPTVLCNMPYVRAGLGSARVIRVLERTGEGV